MKLLSEVSELVVAHAGSAGRPVSAAEYLDRVRTCLRLDVAPGSDVFELIAASTLW